MARLLRVHFSSIGHGDARLAPLSLDFRHAGEDDSAGTGADSVVWLRNGGGKSSILNLFYSVFRPSAREFLGSSAEGKARRLEQYVKGRDLAFVVSEWDVAPPVGPELFAGEPTQIRIVGQMLAWRHQRRSTDMSNLRRLYFSLPARAGVVAFDHLPIQGLGGSSAEPATSFDGFRDWLRDLQMQPGTSDVVYTDHQQKWAQHLEQVGLDPELFRYQLSMNKREGAADEEFRFNRDADFVKYLLELSFDSRVADQIASNLEAQRENLRARPTWELERRFIGEVLERVRPLGQAAETLGDASTTLQETTSRVAATVAGLEVRAASNRERVTEGKDQAEKARERARLAENERAKIQRWARGLERLALQLDEREAQRTLAEVVGVHEEAERERACAQAGEALREVTVLEAKLRELREALARAEAEIEPLRQAAADRGAILWAMLDTEHTRVQTSVQTMGRLVDEADAAEAAAHDRERRARDQALELKAEVEQLESRLERRDRARERLAQHGHLDPRESAVDADARWEHRLEELAETSYIADRDRSAAAERQGGIRSRRSELRGERAEHQAHATTLSERLEAAVTWRDRLRTDERFVEVEGSGEANLESPRLEARLLNQAQLARKKLLDARVDGAEDVRSLAGLRERGLLPSPLEVERVVAALAAKGIVAHAGPDYLERNVPADRRTAVLGHDPSRFSGVIVIGEDALQGAEAIDVEGLRAPVQVSTVRALDSGSGPEGAHVMLPDAALYDAAAGAERRPQLEAAVEKREREARGLDAREKGFLDAAAELRRFVSDHGGGRLDQLERELAGRRQRVELADEELARLDQQEAQASQAEVEATARLATLRENAASARVAAAAVREFLDEHESGIEDVRSRRVEAASGGRRAEDEAMAAEAEVKQHRARARELDKRRLEQEAEASRIQAERDGIAHVADARAAQHDLPLEAARAAYDTARRQYEGEITSPRIQAEIDVAQEQLERSRGRRERAARGLDAGRIEAFARRADLDDELERLRRLEREQVDVAARARAHHELAKAALDEANKRRREGEDVPPGPRPDDAVAARSLAKEMVAQAEQHSVEIADAEQERLARVRDASTHEEEARACDGHVSALRGVARGASIELPERPPLSMEERPDEIARQIERLGEAFAEAKDARVRAERDVERWSVAVRRVASRSEFVELRAQYQERLKESTEVLREQVGGIADELGIRLEVVKQAIEKLDQDRELIVVELLHLADQIKKLLERAERASRLPPTLEGWAGKPYLKIGFGFPDSDEERRGRLAPLVDQLVEEAQIPGGIELVFRAAVELAGSRGFDVRILKPDTVLRPDPIPLHLMSTFSRGQQLTAAILLYCTLVQLRARTRGRDHRAQDAGVLILDNPIGTCSNVALLQLQRQIAVQMRVQLVYTTGVEDLEALATLPNKIRLRNTHRDRNSGDFHVTPDEDQNAPRGAVQAVRLVEVPAR